MADKKYIAGISTTVDISVDIRTIIGLAAQNGFKFISLCADVDHSAYMDHEKFARILEFAGENDLKVKSAHVPFEGEYVFTDSDKEAQEKGIDKNLDLMKFLAEYGIRQAIIHPHYYVRDGKELTLERAVAALERLISEKPGDIDLAVENLPGESGPWIFERLMEIFDDSLLGFCYDSSHENISGPSLYLLDKFYSRMTTCHLSDNNGRRDEHLIPGGGNIDWNRLRGYFDRSELNEVLFEVGTGEKLAEPIEGFMEKTAAKAREIFGIE
jgi:sugar phosphate isomerase/epimerase